MNTVRRKIFPASSLKESGGIKEVSANKRSKAAILTNKGLKLSLVKDRSIRRGIAVRSLKHLKFKAKLKFPEAWEDSIKAEDIRVYLADGTEVEDEEYFGSIPPQTLLLLAASPEEVENNRVFSEASEPFGIFLEVLRKSMDMDVTLKAINSFFSENRTEKLQLIQQIVEQKENKVLLSHRNQDPEWFQDISTNAKTKEEYMKKNCQARIRGYLAKAESQVRDAKVKSFPNLDPLDDIFLQFRRKLKQNQYHGSFFDRSAVEKSERICDTKGTFVCEGRYDDSKCHYAKEIREMSFSSGSNNHFINPYESPESRILFSTWNLDHVIEKSRSIIPTLISTVKNFQALKQQNQEGKKCINEEYFYSLLFTRENLKLVHIVCHDKQEHSKKTCDPDLLFRGLNETDI